MTDTPRTLRPLFFGGCVLVVAVLYWAQALLVPIAIALLLTFLLTPLVGAAERWIGRVAAVLGTVTLAFSILGLISWTLAREVTSLAADLPGYRQNIRQKIHDIRGAGKGGSVEKIQATLEDIQHEIAKNEPDRSTRALPVVVSPDRGTILGEFPTLIGSLLEPLATVGLVIALVIFVLLERKDLRNRLIGLIGHGHLTVTTKAFDEAATRVSRYLLMQSLVNVTYGIGIGVGLFWIGAPYAWLWAALAAALRFIPYLGPWIGAAGPLLVTLAAFPGWTRAASVAGLFVVLELFTYLVVETILYAGAAGVSQVALLIAVAFWTWLWGPLGLLMATPLTVCLVVLGKHVHGLEFLSTLLASTPALAPNVSYYQRLLARDQGEAADLIEQYVKTHGAHSVYDALLLPALNYVERDRLEERLSADEEQAVVDATREIMADVAMFGFGVATGPRQEVALKSNHIPILGYPANSEADAVALDMLQHLLQDTPLVLELVGPRTLPSEMVPMIQANKHRILCIADLPPSAPSKTRYLVKKLRAANPQLKILVGRWAPPPLADESAGLLLEAGADHVASSLIDTRDELWRIARLTTASPTPSASDAA